MKIIKYKKIKNKYRVYFDNDTNIDLYEDIILKNNLLLKKEVDDKKLEKIKKENSKEEIYDKSLKYISIKMRTKNEIKKYLGRFKYNLEDINLVIDRLEKNGLLNEENYIKAYIYDKMNLTSDGPNKIKANLINEKMNQELIDKYIDEISEEEIKEKLDKIVEKKIKTIKNCSGNVLKYKVVNHFYLLGYEKNMIEEVLSNKNISNNNGEKEYTKLYNKYSKKYEGDKLENIIRQKLYLKGYDLDEIKRNID